MYLILWSIFLISHKFEAMDRLYRLFEDKFRSRPFSVIPIAGSASPRNYYRMTGETGKCVGVIGTDRKENMAFLALAVHFRSKNIPVPEVYAVSEDSMAYIQEDLGDEVLLDMYMNGRKTGNAGKYESLFIKTVTMLPDLQFKGAEGLDFSVCHPQQEFSYRTVMFDLNYFKYCFLKPTGLEFDAMCLQDDFEKFAEDLVGCSLSGEARGQSRTFMYRDCQARNVMIRDGAPYFIDFQGGMQGPVYYDVASFIWHARAGYDDELKGRMLDAYLDALSAYVKVDRTRFMADMRLFLLFRYLQVLGAYGFRGWVEQKANFVVSIPEVIKCLTRLLQEPFDRYPYLMSVLKDIVALPELSEKRNDERGKLLVTIYSFSFKKGIPRDPSGNGGGYVFDCRSIHNPGRYEPYKALTGTDEPVIRFLEEDGEVSEFMEHVYSMVDSHVKTYVSRGFSNLMVSFGCTGGRHRSVYCADHLADHLSEKYPDIDICLIHREQGLTYLNGCRK